MDRPEQGPLRPARHTVPVVHRPQHLSWLRPGDRLGHEPARRTRRERQARRLSGINRPSWTMLVVVTTVGVIGGALAAGYALRQDAGPVRPAIEVRPSKLERPPPVTRPAIAPAIARIGPEPSAEVRGHRLDMPVQGMASAALQASFNDKRGERVHEAIDILAPRNSAVVAVEDGVIAKLFVSQAGGITIYQFDPTTSYSYYYAHLERYATGLRDGGRVRRGEVIGYVGTTGNAPKDTPHLHFAIFKLSDTKQWWQGAPIDPYDVLR